MFKKALELNPSQANNIGNYALFLEKFREDFDVAEAMYKKALELDPDHANNTGNYANFLKDNSNNFDAAEAMYKKALELDPSDGNITNNYAVFLAENRKEFDNAEALFKKALELDPSHAKATGNYAGFLAYERCDYAAADAMYKKAYELSPNNLDLRVNYSGMLLIRGSTEDILLAQDHCCQVFQLNISSLHQSGAEALLYLCLCSELIDGDHVAPLGHLKKYLEKNWERGEWDFSPIFEATFPHFPADRHNLYRALGAAILDADAVKALDEFDLWRSVKAVDLSSPLPE